MNGTIFLDITAVIDHDGTPVTSYGRSRTDIHIFSDNHITGDRCIRMYECGLMDNWAVAVKFKDIGQC